MTREEKLAARRAHREAHKEERRAQDRAYYAAHKEERRAYERAYNAAHKEEKRAYHRGYNATHKRQEYRRGYRETNKERLQAQNRAYNAAHKEEQKAWREAHKEEQRAYSHVWWHGVGKPRQQANPLLVMLNSARSRARHGGGICTITVEDLAAMNGTHCPVFGKPYVMGERGHLDSRTVDKIRPPLWYVPGNVAIISRRANVIKQDAISDELYGAADCLEKMENGIFPEIEASPLNDLMLPRSVRYKVRMLINARMRAKRDGIECTITTEDFVIPDRCPYFGLELRIGNGKIEPCSPSLDRIDPSKGYVPGNVVVISYRANAIKNDATAAEIRKVAEWLKMQENTGFA